MWRILTAGLRPCPIGNGINDDSPAIQRALDSGAAEIRFEPGRYLLNSPVVIPSHVEYIDFSFCDLVAGLVLKRSDREGAMAFIGRLSKQQSLDWYRDHANAEIAERYVDAVEATLKTLAETPGLGRPRFREWPKLAGLHSWPVRKPYHRHLIFYRFDDRTLFAERVLHGARDLPRRLRQPPEAAA